MLLDGLEYVEPLVHTTYGSQANVSCTSGWGLIEGKGTITCQEDGTWSAMPQCTRELNIIISLICFSWQFPGDSLTHCINYALMCILHKMHTLQ